MALWGAVGGVGGRVLHIQGDAGQMGDCEMTGRVFCIRGSTCFRGFVCFRGFICLGRMGW